MNWIEKYRQWIAVSVFVANIPCLRAESGSYTNSAGRVGALVEAEKLQSEGKYDKAILCCDELIAKGGHEVRTALKMKGDCLLQLRHYAEAGQCWEGVLKHRVMLESDDDVVLRLAELYGYSLGQTNKADKLYRALFAKNPPSPLLPLARYQYAGMIYNAGDYTNAAILLGEYINRYPESANRPQVENHLKACEKALEDQRKLQIAQQSSAVLAAAKARAERPKSRSEQEFKKAEVLFSHKLYKEALNSYRQVKNDAYSLDWRAASFRMGQCYAELGNTTLAIRQWEETAGARKNDTNTMWVTRSLKAMGDAYFDVLADTKLAMGAYRKLTETYPESPLIPETLKQIGLVYLYEDRLGEAKAVFEQLLAARSREDLEAPPTELDRLMAFCEGRHNDKIPGIRLARDARMVSLLRRGEIYFLAKDYEKALSVYKAVEKRGQGSEDGAYALMQAGRCENQLRRYQEALQCYKRFLDDYRQSQWADDALVKACVVCVGPLNNPAMGAKMCEAVLKDHPSADQADVALLHLATLAYWKQDWKTAKELHERLLHSYPKSRYARAVEQVRLPEIERQMKMAMRKGNTKS